MLSTIVGLRSSPHMAFFTVFYRAIFVTFLVVSV